MYNHNLIFYFFNIDYNGSTVSIRLQQEVYFVNQHHNSLAGHLLLSFITNEHNFLYDSRVEDLPKITENLKQIINNTISLQVYDSQITSQYASIVRDFETFTFYVQNRYLSISASDLIQISIWLNNQWKSSKPTLFLIRLKYRYIEKGKPCRTSKPGRIWACILVLSIGLVKPSCVKFISLLP